MKKYLAILVLGLGFAFPAVAGGVFQGYPTVSMPRTGAETIPADTNLSGGRAPQTILMTLDQIKQYVFGNGGTASATAIGTATASGGAATLNSDRGVVTSEGLTTAAGAAYTLTLTDSVVLATSVVLVEVDNGTNTQGIPVVGVVTPAAGSVVVKVWNLHASQALNGTLKVRFVVLN